MNKLIVGLLAALVIGASSLANAQCGCGAKAEGAAPAGAKMCCPCMAVQGITLTDAQKARVDGMQAKCKDGCPAGCCKACAAAMKEILTPEQQKQWQENLAAARKAQGACCAPKAEDKK